MAFRKQYKSKKSAKKWRKRKAKATYPDRHNWKLEAGASVIYNSAPSVVSAKGSVFIGNVVKQRDNFYQFGGAFNFNLSNVISTDNFLSSNFDRYKINGIKIRVIPENNFSNTSGGGTLATMKVCYDFDDSICPTVGDIEVRRGRTHLLNKPFTISLTPKILQQVYLAYNGVTKQISCANSPVKATWINMGNPSVPHYGVKFMVRDWYSTTAPNDLQVRFQITYMISTKEQIAIGRGPSLVEEYDPDSAEIPTDPSGNQVEVPSLYNPPPRE